MKKKCTCPVCRTRQEYEAYYDDFGNIEEFEFKCDCGYEETYGVETHIVRVNDKEFIYRNDAITTDPVFNLIDINIKEQRLKIQKRKEVIRRYKLYAK